jgi:hypothetical protein
MPPRSPDRPTYSVAEISQMLADRAQDVAETYAPRASGAYVDGSQYWTLNPGRADNSVGSFVIEISGPRAGKWRDFAMSGQGAHGDLLDLIRLSLNCTMVEALREARQYLGLMSDSPEDIRRRKDAAELAKRRREEARAEQAEAALRKSRNAKGLWLAAQQGLRGTPVDHYLREARRINLEGLGRQPGALRYAPALRYQHIDPSTGEIFEGSYPALVALVTDLRGNDLAVHRTWLAYDGARGRWDKAPVPKAKKVYGDYRGGAIHLSRGADTGPRGGRGPALRDCAPGTHVFIAEGIEDALSVLMVLPDVRVLAAISLSNLASVELPANVSRVTLVADQDEGAQAQRALQVAIDSHARAGREVRLWKNRHGGKDLNDALRAAQAAHEEGAA